MEWLGRGDEVVSPLYAWEGAGRTTDMGTPVHEREIVAELQKLRPAQQQQVLAFARTLAGTSPKGTKGSELLAFAGSIEPDDLARIAREVEEGCEQVDLDGW